MAILCGFKLMKSEKDIGTEAVVTLPLGINMKILVVDDEKPAVNYLLSLLKQVEPEAFAAGFTDPAAVFSYLEKNKADIALLDIEMGAMNGISLAKRCKALCPGINIIFVTGYTEYALDAFRLHVSGYLLKPVRREELREELDELRHPIPLLSEKRVRIQTFGNFEVFSKNQTIHFGRAKAKELFAYLIDRKGAAVTMAEIAAVLWEDQGYGRSQLSQIHTFLAEIKNALAQAGYMDVLVKKRNSVAVNVDSVDCDYYKFLEGDIPSINSFTGEYMTNYSWAEFTVGSLNVRSN